MGIQRWGESDTTTSFVQQFDDGEYVLFTDHEQVVADIREATARTLGASTGKLVEAHEEIDRLRAELAAKSKEVEVLNVELAQAYGRGFPDFNEAMGEGNGR